MDSNSIDQQIIEDNWSDLSQFQQVPEINIDRMSRYRMGRIKEQLVLHDVALVLLVNPVSLRYAVEYRSYPLFQSHIPQVYLVVQQF